MKRIWTAALLLAASATMAVAADNAKLLSVQLTSGTADFATVINTPVGGEPFAGAYDHSEWGWKIEYWNMMGPEYAFTISGGMGLFGEENKPGTGATPGLGTQKYSQSSWNFRVGGDRMLAIGDKSFVFFGPGIEYWNGKAKFEDETPPSASYETESTTRISLDARVGGHMMLNPKFGITVEVGTKVGHASVEETGAKTSWWPSSGFGSVGLTMKLGGS